MDTSKQNIFDFLARTSNIGGSTVSLTSIVGSTLIHAPGIVTLGLGIAGYFAGFLLFSQSKQTVSFDVSDRTIGLTVIKENIHKLQENIDSQKSRIPQEILDESHEIFSILEEIMPRWKELDSFAEQKFTINAILTDYFPAVINNYLNLPASYYKNATKKQVAVEIVDQLGTLKTALETIRDTLYSGVENDIKVQSAFLKDRFLSMESNLKL